MNSSLVSNSWLFQNPNLQFLLAIRGLKTWKADHVRCETYFSNKRFLMFHYIHWLSSFFLPIYCSLQGNAGPVGNQGRLGNPGIKVCAQNVRALPISLIAIKVLNWKSSLSQTCMYKACSKICLWQTIDMRGSILRWWETAGGFTREAVGRGRGRGRGGTQRNISECTGLPPPA